MNIGLYNRKIQALNSHGIKNEDFGENTFTNKRAGFSKFRGIIDVVMIAVMLPVVLTLLSGIATTGDPTTDAMLTAITAIVPIILIMDVLTGLF